jgi:thioredoxin reductase (NADPH)
MLHQAEKYGLQFTSGDVTDLARSDDGTHVVRTAEEDYTARAVILAGGAGYDRLGVPGEERLTGRGVSYCATCDAAFFKEQAIAVIGGGDSAIDEALFASRYAGRVYVVHRREALRASAILQERAFAEPKVEFVWNTVVEEILGEETVTGARIRNTLTGDGSTLDVTGVFVAIGLTPNTAYLRGTLAMDDGGHVYVNEWMETEVPGLFAAGDVRANSARQLVTAAGDGATAAIRADRYISERFEAKAHIATPG